LKNFFEEIPQDIYHSETKESFFPLLLIVQILEFFANKNSFENGWVINFLRKTVNVSFFDLYVTYQIMYDHYFGLSAEIFDSNFEIPKENKFRILKGISILMHRWTEYVDSFYLSGHFGEEQKKEKASFNFGNNSSSYGGFNFGNNSSSYGGFNFGTTSSSPGGFGFGTTSSSPNFSFANNSKLELNKENLELEIRLKKIEKEMTNIKSKMETKNEEIFNKMKELSSKIEIKENQVQELSNQIKYSGVVSQLFSMLEYYLNN
jgi:hypothetical protein